MEYQDILFEIREKAAWIIINRPEKYNAFSTNTIKEICLALEKAELDDDVRVVVLRGAGDKAFCTGGDIDEKGEGGGYNREMDYWHTRVHQMIRMLSKPVIAAVNGWAIGGGHIIHLICDISIAADSAKFGQAGPRVGSFDAGFGAAYLARAVGEKKAREIWFLCKTYTAQEAHSMGLVNKVVPLLELDAEVEKWCQDITELSPTAIKFLKASFNADTDHMFGYESMSQIAVRQYWGSEEAKLYKEKFKQKKR
ncbi:MAG: enoyl-CoA hydratase-related protein [Thermincola sp.]|nr:enoyl-CoA hydratase-related protein [Thermincola sp.]MDT3704125.1 enoyl-CoA hydratase-related protein [Thermincola sp.]